MKINAKLFLLTFVIITFISIGSAFIYHTLAQQLIRNQESRSLINSANDFIFALQDLTAKIDENYKSFKNYPADNFQNTDLDFIFEINQDSNIVVKSLLVKDNTQIFKEVESLTEFINYNTNLIIRNHKTNNKNVFYGAQIKIDVIKTLSEKIRAEIALVEENVVSIFTNNNENQYYLPYLSRVSRELKEKNNFELIQETIEDVDFSATHYSPRSSKISSNKIDFLIFNISHEAATFRSTMNLVTMVIVISGILLTIIFQFLFTTKFRKQLEFITDGVKEKASGNSQKRVKIISKDEIGDLGMAFNNMLGEIEKRDISEKDYAEFVSIINQNPSLEEVGDATLQKIVTSTNVDAGAFYLYEDNYLESFSMIGLSKENNERVQESSFYKNARERKELVEVHFKENNPIIKTGIAELKINYLYILPIFYNNNIIAILELASVNEPKISIEPYLNKIKEQLAIGIANGKALSELKNLVGELQKLNFAYQEQNEEITNKNEELLELHDQLKRGSKELEIQTTKAVESERIKSQFLANMSHELRTPQNSILGLTELIIKDETTSPKTRERLNVVLRNGKKLLTLIENILEYSKLESGNTEIKKSSITLSDLVSEVSSFIDPLFLEREVEFIIETTNQDYQLNTDVKKVEQIIYNLVGNAAKFTKEGHIKLKFEAKNKDLEIIVSDTGPGISEVDKEIIFDEFRQADGNLDRKFSGTGLGLTICKRYTELLEGTIELTSSLDVGSEFTVNLNNVIVSNPIEISKQICSQEKITSLNAVIISSGNDSIKLISDYLKTFEITVNVKDPNDIELNYIKNLKPDIVVLDILSANKNGWQILADIKSDNNLSETPVVVVNMDEEANCGLGLNVYKYCSQLLNKNNVFKMIETIEEQQRIKFRKLMFIMNEQKFNMLEDELLPNELKIHNSYNSNAIEDIKTNEPDLIIIDLFDEEINPINLLTKINSDPYSNSIPVIAFFDKTVPEEKLNYLNNSILESTLLNQYHPLDVLKVIKDRIELINSNIFSDSSKFNDSSLFQKITRKQVSDNIKVLIVDDNKDARFTIGEIIKTFGYDAVFASNGFECLDKLDEELPDLVLLDIMMPQMDGFQTIKKIRENSTTKNLTVFALTAYAMLSDKEIIEKNGFNGLFTKPVNTVQLERKLNQIFTTIA